MAGKKKKRNKKNFSKKTDWESFEKYIDRLFDWAYVSKINRYDRRRHKKVELPKHIITKENTKKGYVSQVKQYVKWVYTKKGESNLRYFKKKWYEEYLEEKISDIGKENTSVSSIFTQIAALTKFENILEAKWRHDKGETVQFGVIADKRVRETLKENEIYRNIEDMKKSRPIWNDNTFLKIENQLSGENKKLWRFLGTTGMRLESALLFQKKDIQEECLHIEHGKAGKRSDVHLLNPVLINKEIKDMNSYVSSVTQYIQHFANDYINHKQERRIFDGFKKEITIDGNTMEVNKKISTIKSDFEKAVREAGANLGLSNITPHSARKYYCNSVYVFLNHIDEKEVNDYLCCNKDKYESTFRKELSRINQKRRYPRNYDFKTNSIVSLSSFNQVLNHFTHEEKAALISSFQSSHHRIQILNFYVNRTVARKIQGAKKWK
ncbi:hypothetical protein [Bacillus sp. S/N-304-OC-R1]|uniref:hypothetical protein n=1 Tax=Bacillus sp. S/N-304-OC-R1 TaxID=2758034 RepID=UPI001C8F126B|nr:hypothetical protein [Bacillus sp. S/N-304-OC-R1]MBY0123191.1 hypothetical protein [Bacillus sp. S/N-304-OC-R1]